MRSKLLTFTPATRALLVVCALTVFVLAVVATIGSVRERREDAVRVHEANAYADVARAADRQRFLLASSRRARTTKTAITSLSHMAQESLDELRARSSGAEAATAAALSVSYGMASRRAAGSVGGTGGGKAATARQAQLELASIEATAEAALQARQRSVLEASPSLLLDSFQIVAMALVGILALFGSALVLRSGREPQAAQRDVELERLEVEARTDNLTGLGNHRAFHHDLSLEVQRRARTGSVFALMAIDLDGLKQINDSQGHQAGDVYIRRVCEIARTATGREGTVYRTGGDEFMVLLPGSRNWNALALANRIDRHTREALGRRALSIGLTESTGTEARHLLIHQADVALYEAKRTRLTALTYHPGLTGSSEVEPASPSHHQRTLAAALARAVDAKDAGTRSHSETVAEIAVAIGKVLRIGGEGLERLRLAGLLHDVGTIGVSDSILHKPAALRLEEEDEMKEHVSIGHGILLSAELPTEAVWVLHHHERVDGNGYPNGLKSDQIPLESRIIAVADAFEAMTGTRPYRESLSVADALEELRANTDDQFDGRCVTALTEVLEDVPAALIAEGSQASEAEFAPPPAGVPALASGRDR